MAQKASLFENKIAEANKEPEYERVDHGPNFKPGWKHSGNSGGGHTGHDGKFKKQTKRVETKFANPPPPPKSLSDLP